MWKTACRKTWSIIYWLPTGIFLSSFYHIEYVSGRSMQPTLNPDSSQWRDIVLFSRFAAPWHQYQRDDIVSVRSPEDPKRILIKRILATEGDIVKTLPPYPDREVLVPKGHAWIEGDEHFLSDDSNRFGPISQSLIQSKFVLILWPIHRFGFLKAANSRVNAGSQLDRHALAEMRRDEVRYSRVRHKVER